MSQNIFCIPKLSVRTCFLLKRNKLVISVNKFNKYQYIKFYSTTSSASSSFKFDNPKKTNVTKPLTEKTAYDIIINITENERVAIKNALMKFEAIKCKEGFEGQLAATRWRSRFGRPTKLPALGEVDPTGAFCPVPDSWLKEKAVQAATPPSSPDLWRLFLVNAVPFIGFGFLDNFTMIVAGDYIEKSIGMYVCISTMAAAGLGNTLSDVLGIGSAFYVERFCEFLGFTAPNLTAAQMSLKSSQRTANWGRIVGITVGCLVGMLPLLFTKSAVCKDKKEDIDRTIKTAKEKI